MRAMDVGANKKLCLHGSEGPLSIPKTPRGFIQVQQYEEIMRICLQGDDDLFGSFPAMDLVMESPSIGGSGIEPRSLWDNVVNKSDHDIWFLPARAVKNFKRRHGLKGDDVTERQKRTHLRDLLREKGLVVDDDPTDDALSAAIIYHLATENPGRLKKWCYVPEDEKFHRTYTSVRPHDKRDYTGPEPDRWMSLLPSFCELPDDMQLVYGNGKNYSRSRAMPFAMALEEGISGTRDGYEKVLGLYGHGYPSFYRRATEDLRQHIAKKVTGLSKIDELTEEQHKESRRITRWYIRRLYHLAQGNTNPAEGKTYPVPTSRLGRLQGNSDPAEGKADPSLFDI